MPSLRQFIATRSAGWAALEALLGRSEGNGLRRLSAAELDALGRGYRTLMSDVALARRDFPDDQLTLSLNALAARAHLRLYRAPGASWVGLWRFFAVGFPRRCREAWAYVVVAAALLLVPAVVGYGAALSGDEARAALVPEAMRTTMERGETWTDVAPALRPAMAAVLFTNNIRVSFLAFAGGALAGLGTVYALAFNGLFLGAVLGAGQHYGVAHLLVDFVSAHAYVELTCITIAGGAGLMLGWALLRPGLLRRRDALTRAGRRALALVVGAAPIFVVAGIVEAIVSPSALPTAVKVAIGLGLWLALLAFLFTSGRRNPTTGP